MKSAVLARFASLVLLVLCASAARAHEFKLDALVSVLAQADEREVHLLVRAPLYLFRGDKFPSKDGEVDVRNAGPALERALASLQQSVVLLENGQPLAVRRASARLSLPSDRSFDDFATAAAHIAAPPEPDMAIVVDQGHVDAQLVYAVRAPRAVYALRTSIAPELGPALKLAIRFAPAGAEPRGMIVNGGTGTTLLNPGPWAAAASFTRMGMAHIVTGADHLLFLLCLVIPLRGLRPLLMVVTGFTVAHSFTLIGSAFGLAPTGAWFPPFVEVLIAASIVYTALENIVGVDIRRRVLLGMLFGLAHGFGFSQGLSQELQFAGTHLVVALFAFNIGIELGQIAMLVLLLPLLALVSRHVLAGRVGQIILAALLAHVGWHWMADRWDALLAAPLPQPGIADLVALLMWGAGLCAAAALAVAALGRTGRAPAARPEARPD